MPREAGGGLLQFDLVPTRWEGGGGPVKCLKGQGLLYGVDSASVSEDVFCVERGLGDGE